MFYPTFIKSNLWNVQRTHYLIHSYQCFMFSIYSEANIFCNTAILYSIYAINDWGPDPKSHVHIGLFCFIAQCCWLSKDMTDAWQTMLLYENNQHWCNKICPNAA